MTLDTGILKELFSVEEIWTSKPPFIVQITNIRPIPNEAGKRYRLIISDGIYTSHAVIRPEGVPICEKTGIQKSSILKVMNYELDIMGINKKHVVVIGECSILQAIAGKVGGSLATIDEYFTEHPKEDRYIPFNASAASNITKNNTFSPSPKVSIPSKYNQQSKQQSKQPNFNPTTNSKLSNTFEGNYNSNRSNHSNHPNIYPIDQLSPYQNTWTIKARVSFKSPIRTWSNAKGEGKLFNCNFLDESNEIRATAFNDQVDKFYEFLQEGKAYFISKARINPARSQFSNLSHPYELSLDRDTEIEICNENDADTVPKLNFKFVQLTKIQALDSKAIIDCIGILKEVLPSAQIVSKNTGKSFDKRDVVLVDDTNVAINLSLWNKTAVDFNFPIGSVIGIKGARINDFGGRGLSLTQSGSIISNPDVPEAFRLKGWYDNLGHNQNFQSLKNDSPGSGLINLDDRKTIAQVETENLGSNEKPDYFSIKAFINYIKPDNFFYTSCKSENCNRKVMETSDKSWRCEKCDMNFSEPNYRYILTCSIIDSTGQIWITLFEESAKKIIGMDAKELLDLKEEDDAGFKNLLETIQTHEYNFRLSARLDNYNGQSRVRYQAQSADMLDYNAECDNLVKLLEKLSSKH
ncbi:replication factor A subunit protein RFA1 [Ascoidea rubescens DSM 1968]|uniref:Replication protein A subunit n=1 Tax=Ascoidea rubescens DSM 1968 TaxID=1344418 RepID=A0A1D2VHC6_9ASCO|nr:replication protein A 70 kDa DNA-binding subunit [Ascoidea rubescens DSM 1968]ODV61025.1 replication protein A 70 kDa DNA-binding subunit [Ascoidea rubescens DSM 1968]